MALLIGLDEHSYTYFGSRNGRQIARFLSSANSRFLPFARADRLMKGHLDDTLDEAADQLGGDFSLQRPRL
jgi:hypothetical protein